KDRRARAIREIPCCFAYKHRVRQLAFQSTRTRATVGKTRQHDAASNTHSPGATACDPGIDYASELLLRPSSSLAARWIGSRGKNVHRPRQGAVGRAPNESPSKIHRLWRRGIVPRLRGTERRRYVAA